MEEREFLAQADALLARLETALEALQEQGVAFDFEFMPGGVLELLFVDGSKIVINRHAAMREIWVATRSGGFHFRPPSQPGEPWRDTRSGTPFAEVLARCIGEQAGQPAMLTV